MQSEIDGTLSQIGDTVGALGHKADVKGRIRLNARSLPKTGSEPVFRRNMAACGYTIEAAHNPEVAGSNPAPATGKALGTGPFVCETLALPVLVQA